MADRILTIDRLLAELTKYNHNELHVHHTWKPDHSNWKAKSDAKYWNDSMRNYHIKDRGFKDIAQHVTLTPDGLFITGRPFGMTPASIAGHNTKYGLPFMVEMLGNFDKGHDKFGGAQKASMLRLAKWFDDRGKYIRFHRENAAKTCPGSGIDKVTFMAEARGQKISTGGTGMIYGKVLRRGDKGSAVKKLQQDLTKLGVSVGSHGADGSYGPATELAVKSFQRIHKLQIDGICGPATQAKIAQLLKAPPKPSTDYKKRYEELLAKVNQAKKILG